jgi:hypothetical protein
VNATLDLSAFATLDTTTWPSFSFIRGQLSESGFHFGEVFDDYETLVSNTTPIILNEDLDRRSSESDVLYRCASRLIEICETRRPHVNPALLSRLAEGAFVGPKQLLLLEKLSNKGFAPRIIAGYRSPAYQALLFAARYLMGTLVDRFGRYTVAPPGCSDHQLLDGALDVENSVLFMRALLSVIEALPMTLSQPYLSDPVVTHEPWHWRTQTLANAIHLATSYASPPLMDWAKELSDALDALTGCGNESAFSGQDHVFALGISTHGHSFCIGSCQPTISRSIADALDAIGTGWSAKYLSIPLGYTPLFDNQVQPHDIGRSIFKIRPRRGNAASAFLTGAGCITHRVLSPSNVTTELLIKAGSTASDEYRIEKTKTVDLLILPSDHPVPSAHGVPINPFERDAELPILLVYDYCKWLARSTDAGLPIHSSNDYGRTYSSHCDPMRYALVLAFLTRYARVLPDYVSGTRDRLWGIFGQGSFGRDYRAGGASPVDPIPEATCVFIAQALFHSGEHEMLRALWDSQSARLGRYVESAMLNDEDANGWLFVGHLCQFATEAVTIDSVEFMDLGLTPENVTRLIIRSRLSLLHACACAQMLRYLSVRCRNFNTLARDEEIELLLCRLLAAEPSAIEEEDGAFCGLESFQSSLPGEAIFHLRRCRGLSDSDDSVILGRTARLLRFLRRLQFQPGTGVLTTQPSLVEGAVRYSLIDHHYRIDYGVHAATAAIEFAIAARIV